jgi:small conductance mechanosensitive channel
MFPLETPPTAVNDSIKVTGNEWQMLKNMSFDDLVHDMISSTVKFAINLAIALAVFYIGKFIIKKVHRLLSNIFIRRDIDKSLATFLLSMYRIVSYFILIIIAIGIIGIETSSFIALFASAGVAIGMALSGTLQNFAGGVLILLLKPYRIGDYIEAQGYSGTVTEIQIFHTIICTADNKSISIPNGGLSTGSINNWSREDYRRVDWTVGISYGDSVSTAREVILKMLLDDERVVKQYIEDDREERRLAALANGTEEEQREAELAELTEEEIIAREEEEYRNRSFIYRMFHRHPKVVHRLAAIKENMLAKAQLPKVDRAPVVVLDELADSSVNLKVRAWTQSKSYWSLYYDINEKIYNELPTHGVSFPFPQMDVHLVKE